MNGEHFLSEIREQPDALRRLLATGPAIADVGRRVAQRRPSIIRLVAHGTSDNAATFGIYVFGLIARTTALRDSISLPTYYGRDTGMDDSVVIALSQSGQTPDVIEYVTAARAAGAHVIAISNDPESDLAAASDDVIALEAGPEQALAATKTYMNELAGLYLLAEAIAGEDGGVGQLTTVAGQLEQVLESSQAPVAEVASELRDQDRLCSIGRGLEYATARETALKLTETCHVLGAALTSTDFVHGPIAAMARPFPLWSITSEEACLPSTLEAAGRAHAAGAPVIAVGAYADSVDSASYRISTPPAPASALGPLLSIVPAQLFAWALAGERGSDPDGDGGLATKVTLAP